MQLKMVLDGEITVISLSGRIDIDKTQSFKQACVENFADKKLIFCMKNLSFVGSTGIQSFFNVLNELKANKKVDVKISGLNSDFRRLLNFTECSQLEVHEDIEGAMQSF